MLKVGLNSTARIRILGEPEQVTLRSRGTWALAPGQIITLRVDKPWNHSGDAYASGKIEGARIDVTRLGLEVLPLDAGDLENLREIYESLVSYADLTRPTPHRRARPSSRDLTGRVLQAPSVVGRTVEGRDPAAAEGDLS